MREGGLSMADLHIPLDRKLFVGIDPGQTGGLGIVDEDGQFVAAYRWDRREPRRMYQILEALAKGNTGNTHCQADNRLNLFARHRQGLHVAVVCAFEDYGKATGRKSTVNLAQGSLSLGSPGPDQRTAWNTSTD